MKGPKEYKDYAKKHRKYLKAIHWDDLMILLKFPNCKKWRKIKRRPRDGYNGNDQD